jgi:hypothetical protein
MRSSLLFQPLNLVRLREVSMKVYSYVVEHDNGYAPNPYFGFCTLCGCKFEGGKNIVQLAKVGDWVIGTGGVSKRSAQHGNLVYAMRVDKKLTRWGYFNCSQFEKKKPKTGTYAQSRGDNEDPRKDEHTENSFWREAPKLNDRMREQFVLVSRHFWYFGANAIPILEEFKGEKPHGFMLEKKGPGFRNHFEQADIHRLVEWIEGQAKPGRHGEPCGRTLDELKGRIGCKSSC